MPKSKRNKIVPLTKVKKTTKFPKNANSNNNPEAQKTETRMQKKQRTKNKENILEKLRSSVHVLHSFGV